MTEALRISEPSAVEIVERMQSLAEDGDWTAVHGLHESLRAAVNATPPEDRSVILPRLQRSNALIMALASKAQKEIRSQISTIRRGQNAADAYDETHRLSDR